jgi:hypothetical protein
MAAGKVTPGCLLQDHDSQVITVARKENMNSYCIRRCVVQVVLGGFALSFLSLAGCGRNADTATENKTSVQQQAQSIQNDPKIPEEEKARIQQRMQAAQRSQQASGQPKQ